MKSLFLFFFLYGFFPINFSLICAPGFYLYPNICNSCYQYCKTCDGSSNTNCLSCFPDDIYSSTNKNCQIPNNFIEKVHYFFEQSFSTVLPSMVTASMTSAQVSMCRGEAWLGGPSIFGNGDWIKIEGNSPEKHYKLRIKFKFLKVDTWNGNDGQVYVDNVLQDIIELRNIQANDGASYYGNMCVGTSDPENIYIVDYTMKHEKSSFSIKITTNLDGIKTEKSWGIRELIVGIYSCDSSCQETCLGGTSVDCSCSDGKFLEKDGSVT
jgi:hypothetical protein